MNTIRGWFFETFTNVQRDTAAGKAAIGRAAANPDDVGDVWKQVSKLNLYDPLALLAATPGARELVFSVQGNDGVQVIGKEQIKEASILKHLLAGIVAESLRPPVGR